MVKASLCLVLASLSLASTVLAQAQQQCQLAYPMMEVLKCEKTDSFSKQINFNSDSKTKISTATYTCVSDCTINLQLRCGWVSTLKGDVSAGNIHTPLNQGMIAGGLFTNSYKIGDGEQFSVSAYCDVPILGPQLITVGSASDSIVQIQDYNKFLFATNHEWSSHQLTDTTNCIPQSRVSSFINQQIKSGSLPSVYSTGGTDVLGNSVAAPENFVDISSLNLASELKVGNTISYFYRWEPVSSLNLKYDENKNPVYCGGSSDQRKLFSYNTVNTNDGTCYYVPSSIQKNVECCLDGDCHFTGQLCGPSFKCTDKKPCNSDLECGTQEPQCSNNQLTSWTCDSSQGPVNMPNGQSYSGWCTKQTKNVACCQSSCGSGTHCEYDKGCVSDIRIIDCPVGKCCEAGGNYRTASCASGQTCCHSGDPIIGDCKASCQPTPSAQENSTALSQNGGNQLTGFASMISSPSTIPIIALVILAVAGIVGYVIWKNRKPEESLSRKESEKDKKDLLGGDV